jgi:ribosome modulation factor
MIDRHKEGYRAYQNDVELSSCPYSVIEWAEEWFKGWHEAQDQERRTWRIDSVKTP